MSPPAPPTVPSGTRVVLIIVTAGVVLALIALAVRPPPPKRVAPATVPAVQ